MKTQTALIRTAIACTLATPAVAGDSVGIVEVLDQIECVDPPMSLLPTIAENDDTAIIFQETNGTPLTQDLVVDATNTGLIAGTGSGAVPGSIEAGTRVRSYYIHAEPTHDGPEPYAGSVRFETPVLGIIFRTSSLDASDALLSPNTTYASARMLGSADSFVLSPDRTQVTIDFNVTIGRDQIRIITAVPPCAPADLALPFGLLDLSDVDAFVNAFTTDDPAADLALPTGLFDLDDIDAFITSFLSGCP